MDHHASSYHDGSRPESRLTRRSTSRSRSRSRSRARRKHQHASTTVSASSSGAHLVDPHASSSRSGTSPALLPVYHDDGEDTDDDADGEESAFAAVPEAFRIDLDDLDPAAGSEYATSSAASDHRLHDSHTGGAVSRFSARLRDTFKGQLSRVGARVGPPSRTGKGASPASRAGGTGSRNTRSRNGFQRLGSVHDMDAAIPLTETAFGVDGAAAPRRHHSGEENPTSPTSMLFHPGQIGAALLNRFRGHHHGHDDDDAVSFDQTLSNVRGDDEDDADSLTWNQKLYNLLEDPSSSKPALYLSMFIAFMIVASTLVATLETIPSLYSNEVDIWAIRQGIEIFIIAVFTLEYVLRVLARCDSFASAWRFIRSPLGLIDLVAIVPYYVELASRSSDRPLPGETAADAVAAHMSYVFRTTILKTFRLFRVFRVFRHSSLVQLSIEVLIIALKRSLDALSALVFFTVITVTLFSTLLYFAERGTWDPAVSGFVDKFGRPSRFDSIPAACWFVIVTLTTTGYGDMVPQTFVGKVIAFPAMMCGILLIALPSIIVGRNFTVVWEHMKAQRDQMQLEAVMARRYAALNQSSSQPTTPTTATADVRRQMREQRAPPAPPGVTRPSSPANAPGGESAPAANTPPTIPHHHHHPSTADQAPATAAFGSIFDDPFSVGPSAAFFGLSGTGPNTTGGLGPQLPPASALPRDTRQLLLYVTTLTTTIQAYQAHLHDAVAALRESMDLDQLVAETRGLGTALHAAMAGAGAAGVVSPPAAGQPRQVPPQQTGGQV
ncbi:hypothetical protein H9P43_008119 [Blastocladiella emersonii ATCC 22665]|nr:hypothetical protein H9P43_008119 [Blastocladiella emersonii ATCC 22665]